MKIIFYKYSGITTCPVNTFFEELSEWGNRLLPPRIISMLRVCFYKLAVNIHFTKSIKNLLQYSNMLQLIPYPEMVISQREIRQYQTVSSERIDNFRERKKLLNILDFDAENTSDTRVQGVEVLQSDVMIEPHNFPGVYHLDLAGTTYYKRSLLISQRPNRENPRQPTPEEHRSHYERMIVRRTLTSCLAHIRYNPGQISRTLRSFMEYTSYTSSLEGDEIIPVTRFCLKALHKTFHQDSNLVVKILKTYCTIQPQKEDLLDRMYRYDCLEYILESCREVKYDIHDFLINYGPGSIPGFCPIRICTLAYESANLPKIRALVRYGFEPLELNGNLRSAIFFELKMLQLMRRTGLHHLPILRIYRFYSINRRNDFIMELLYMVVASLGPYQDEWIEFSKLFFNSILDPLFREDEVAEVFARICHQEDHELLIRTCNSLFGHLFVQIHEPRSLQHQTRYVIRRLLRDNFQLPVGIDQLGLPQRMTAYLKLEC